MSKILLSTIGSRGDVQPILALALELKELGHTPTLCVPPDFKDWIESFGVAFVPIGSPIKAFSARAPGGKKMKIPREKAREMVSMSVKSQFQVIGDAAEGVDLIVAGGALQTAARSIAEALEIRYVYASYCACTLPSPDHPPPRNHRHSWPGFVNRLLWAKNDRSWKSLFEAPLNEHRGILGLPAIDNVPACVATTLMA